MSTDTHLLLLVSLAVALVAVAQRGLASLPLLALAAGIAGALLAPGGFAPLSPELVAGLFLPGLLYGLAQQARTAAEGRRAMLTGVALGVPGFVLAAGLAGMALWLGAGGLTGLSARWSLLLAGLLVLVDAPLALGAVPLPRLHARLAQILRLEALLGAVAGVVMVGILAALVGAAGSVVQLRIVEPYESDAALVGRLASEAATLPGVAHADPAPETGGLHVTFRGTTAPPAGLQALRDAAERVGVPRSHALIERLPAPPTFFWILREFVLKVAAGVAIGLLLGFFVRALTGRSDDRRLEALLALALAYGAYFAAHALQTAGVAAVIAAGFASRAGKAADGGPPALPAPTSTGLFDSLAQGLTLLAFLLAGSAVGGAELLRHAPLALLAFAVLLLVRAGVVHATTWVLRPFGERLERGVASGLVVGGLHGAVPLVLLLALPADVPQSLPVAATVLGAALIGLAAQGLPLAALLRRLGLIASGPSHGDGEVERLRGRVLAAVRARAHLDRLRAEHAVTPRSYDLLARAYDHKIAVMERNLGAAYEERDALRQDELTGVLREMLRMEAQSLDQSRERGYLSDDVYARLVAQVHIRVARLGDEVDELGPRRAAEPADGPPATSPATPPAAADPPRDPA